jgi:hypothetical protein
MLNPALIVVTTVLAHGGVTDSFFRENEEAIVYTYRAESERKGQISPVPAAASFAAFVDYQKAIYAKDLPRCHEMERRGHVYWVESGTRCQVIRGGGMSVGPIVRTTQEIRLLTGPHKGKHGWIEADQVRRYSPIRVEPPERYTDENWDTPRPRALAYLTQDKVIYRELLAARDKATTAAQAVSRRDRQRQVHFRVFRREHRAVLDRYGLDEATALRILEWGKQGGWPVEEPEGGARSAGGSR